MIGLSTNMSMSGKTDCLKAAGYDFVIRYYSRLTRHAEKRMLRDEAAAISRSGIKIGAVYQDRAQKIRDFSPERGLTDGRYAYDYAAGQIGQPAGSAIYFAVDADFTAAEIRGPIKSYFEGVRQGMDERAGGGENFDIGVYGSGLACRLLRAQLPFVRYSWMSLSTGWRESNTYRDWDILQIKATAELCDVARANWQKVEMKNDFGQFSIE